MRRDTTVGEMRNAAAVVAVLAALLLWPVLFGGRSTQSFTIDDPRIGVRPWAAAMPAGGAAELPAINPITPDIDFFVLPGVARVDQFHDAGAAPWWDAGQLLGYPLAANQPYPLFSPFAAVTHWLDPISSLDWLLWWHTLMGGLLAYRAVRMGGARPAAAALAAVAFPLSTWMVTRWHLPQIMHTTAWWPGMVCGLEWLRRGKAARGALEIAVFLGLSLLSGFPQVAVALGGGLGLLLLLDVRARGSAGAGARDAAGGAAGDAASDSAAGAAGGAREVPSVPSVWRRMLPAAAGVVVAILLAGPVLTLSADAFTHSLRSGEAAQEHMASQSLAPGALLGGVMPELFGLPADFAGPRPPAPTLEAYALRRALLSDDPLDNPVENALYPGMLVLLLLPAMFRKGTGGGARGLALMAATSVGLCLVWPLLSELVPGARVLGAGNLKRMLVLVHAGLPLAAAHAFEALLARRVALPRVGALVLVAVLGGTWLWAGSAGLDHAGSPEEGARMSDLVTAHVAQQLLLLVAGMLALTLAVNRGRGPMTWLPAALLVVDLGLRAMLFNPFPVQGPAFPSTPTLALLAERPGRVAVIGGDNILPPTASSLHGIRSVHGVAPMIPTRTAELLGTIEGSLVNPGDPRILSPFRQATSLDHPLLDLLDVQTIVHGDPALMDTLPYTRIHLSEAEGLAVHDRPSRGRRAFLCGGAEVVPSADARLARLGSRQFDPWATVLLERAPGITLPPRGTTMPVDLVSMDDFAATYHMRTSAAFAGVLVLTEAWDPGWSVEVDDQPGEVLIADHALLGVALEAGEHEVRFVYSPAGLDTGTGLRWLGTMGVLLLGLLTIRRLSADRFVAATE